MDMCLKSWQKTNGGQEEKVRMGLFEPRHKKTCLWGLQPGKTQTDLLNYRD